MLKRKVYPREVGLKRRVVRDDIDVMEYVVASRYVDCYSSVFSRWQIMNREFDTIYIDVDEHAEADFELILKNAYKKLQEVLKLLDGYEVRVYATGRGFAVYLDFPMEHLELYRDATREWLRRKVVEYVKSSSDSKDDRKIEKKANELMKRLFDIRITGDIMRIARLPMTVNSKVGVRCVPINPEWDIDKVKNCMLGKAEPYLYDVQNNVELAKELKEIEKELKEGRKVRHEHVDIGDIPDGVREYVKGLNFRRLPPCIKKGIENLIRYGELDHYWRVVITIFLIKAYGEEKVKKLFEMFASDYNPRITEYQVSFIARKGYYCYGCRKLKDMGICPYIDQRRCAYYVLTNGWLERLFMGKGGAHGKVEE